VDNAPPWKKYVDALIEEWRHTKTLFSGSPDTVFLGGGTPSLMPSEQLKRLIAELKVTDDCEVTLEANPGTVDRDKLADIREAGVNRLSVGIQTFQPRFARFLNRGHSVNEAKRLLKEIKTIGFDSWSADLIFGLPNQTIDDLRLDLDELLASEPPHISLYSLTAEPGTPYSKALENGKFSTTPETIWEQMMELVVQVPAEQNIQRYEVSNLAKPGHRCRHNELYWRGGYWAGLGVGAHGWLPNGLRTENPNKVEDYLNDPCGYLTSIRPTPRERASELLLTHLRHVDGVQIKNLKTLGWDLNLEKCMPLINGGLIEVVGDTIKVKGKGWNLINQVVLHLDNSLSSCSHGALNESE